MPLTSRHSPPYVLILLLATAAGACSARSGPAAEGASAAAAATAPQTAEADRLERSIRAHLQFLASDALHGPGSGTRDEWITATYIGAQLAQLGLEPLGDHGGFVQHVELQPFTLAAPPVLAVGERILTHGSDMLVRGVTGASVSGLLRRYVAGTPITPGSVVLIPLRRTATHQRGTHAPGNRGPGGAGARAGRQHGAAGVARRHGAIDRRRWSATCISAEPARGGGPAATPEERMDGLDR